MKQYSNSIVAFVAGVLFTTVGSAYADNGLTKIEAYLRPSLPIMLNGESIRLESPPVVYDGSTYLKLRDIANLTGITVKWNEETETVELKKDTDINGAAKNETYIPYVDLPRLYGLSVISENGKNLLLISNDDTTLSVNMDSNGNREDGQYGVLQTNKGEIHYLIELSRHSFLKSDLIEYGLIK